MSSVYTVSQVNSYIKQLFSTDLLLRKVYIRGEISNCKYHASGHIYFSLKEEGSQIRCVMFASYRRNLSFRMEDGMRIIACGSVSVYERDGSYQLYCTAARPDGIGALYERYEALKRKLSEMGMFAEEYKQPIPRYITRLGVVTAPTGAAVRDIITVSKRRNPGIQIILYPALVQGDGAAESIALGIRTLDRIGVDTIIAGRGGGSIEDLWAFNEEIVARAIFNCRTPLISAVGHETDTTIADFAADLRAPTPSAAAELAVDDMVQVQMSLRQSRIRLAMLMKQRADYERQKADQFRLKLRLNGPEGRLRDARQRLAHLQERIAMLVSSRVKEERHRADGLRQQLERLITDKRKENRTRTEQLKERLSRDMAQRIRTEKHRLELAESRLAALSPEAMLDRGYVYAQDQQGKTLRSAAQIAEGERILLFMKDGSVRTVAEEICPKSAPDAGGGGRDV